MKHQNASNPQEVTDQAHKVLALLEGLSVEQVRDVLSEADRHVGNYAMNLCRTTAFQLAVAALPQSGG